MQKTSKIKNPRKQRKFLHNAPAHLRHKLMAAPLSKDLAASKGARTLPVRKGDTIRIMRGDHAGFEGKVSRMDLKRYRIFVEGLTREKVDGTNIFVAVHPSKVMIKSLNLDDKWRKAILERKHVLEITKGKERATAQPAKKIGKTKEEKPVKATKDALIEKKQLPEEKPTAKPKKAGKKTAAKEEEQPITEATPAQRKRKEKAPVAKAKSAGKEKKPKTLTNKKPVKRKAITSEKEGETQLWERKEKPEG
jgi:large subunit ribosomal protein L24